MPQCAADVADAVAPHLVCDDRLPHPAIIILPVLFGPVAQELHHTPTEPLKDLRECACVGLHELLRSHGKVHSPPLLQICIRLQAPKGFEDRLLTPCILLPLLGLDNRRRSLESSNITPPLGARATPLRKRKMILPSPTSMENEAHL